MAGHFEKIREADKKIEDTEITLNNITEELVNIKKQLSKLLFTTLGLCREYAVKSINCFDIFRLAYYSKFQNAVLDDSANIKSTIQSQSIDLSSLNQDEKDLYASIQTCMDLKPSNEVDGSKNQPYWKIKGHLKEKMKYKYKQLINELSVPEAQNNVKNIISLESSASNDESVGSECSALISSLGKKRMRSKSEEDYAISTQENVKWENYDECQINKPVESKYNIIFKLLKI